MAKLEWMEVGPDSVKIATHAGWEYRIGPPDNGLAGYTVCRYRFGRNLADAEWFRDDLNREGNLEAAKLMCEDILQREADGKPIAFTRQHASPVDFGPVQQEWALAIPLMQQSVLFAAIRGPDGVRKTHPVKVLMRWYRRCLLLSAFDKRVLTDPFEPGGGSFTGPFTATECREITGDERYGPDILRTHFDQMRRRYLDYVDELPHHFQLHFMHAAQIMGVHHPDDWIRNWWKTFYLMIVEDAHLQPETDRDMNLRLSDDCDAWKAREVG